VLSEIYAQLCRVGVMNHLNIRVKMDSNIVFYRSSVNEMLMNMHAKILYIWSMDIHW